MASLNDPINQVLNADRELAREILDIGPAEAFQRFSDATTLRVTAVGPPAQGAGPWAQVFAGMAPGARLLRRPRDGRASVAGDVGWTWGEFTIETPGVTGAADLHGSYLTAWHRGADGWWRISAEMSQAAPVVR